MASCAFVPTVAAGALVARSAAATSSRRPAAVPSARGVQMLMGGGKGNEAGGGKNPFGALGNMGNIMDAVKKAQQFTESAKELQDELKETEIEATAREGKVKVVLTGQQTPISVTIAPELLDEGADAVSAAVTDAVKAAHSRSLEYMRERLGGLTTDFGLPQQPPQ
ncbi:hypothetical protein BU14_0218s0046 [Porphyra umbilicalis]|uniref:Nucleoid-associated protein n=1 Tax=Porphyra umbilicalis TaxID=2786 RepID=A0A1X6P4S1_PORUM|nr:hypothetical protein BU14_0218s0046 [Porphyra umbilicalis]|eukprot:OSX75881.1 hypothetical protein BU14_0218s0046 [Porphyra umbilicalis]